jgi:hypothetical protein
MEARETSFVQQIRKSTFVPVDKANQNPQLLMQHWMMVASDPELLGENESGTKIVSLNKTTFMNVWEMYQQDDGVKTFIQCSFKDKKSIPIDRFLKTQGWNNEMDKWSKM